MWILQSYLNKEKLTKTLHDWFKIKGGVRQGSLCQHAVCTGGTPRRNNNRRQERDQFADCRRHNLTLLCTSKDELLARLKKVEEASMS